MKKCKNRRCNSDLQDDFKFCPYCGKNQIKESGQKNRRPNGTGSIYFRKDIKNKPWAATSTITGVKVYVGNFKTKTEAVKALQEFEYNPTNSYNLTLEKLFNEWKPIAYRTIGLSAQQNYNAAWQKLKPLYGRKFRDIRTGELQAIIDYYDAPHHELGAEGKLKYIDDKGNSTYNVTEKPKMNDGLKYSALHKLKCLLTKLYTYAMKNDIVNKNYASFIVLPDKNETSKSRFTDTQLELVKQNIGKIPYADYIYCLCYLNFRVSEFLELTAESYNVSDSGIPVFIGGKKTEAGTNRLIPIHPKIQPLVQACLNKKGNTIFCDENGNALTPDSFRRKCFYPAIEALKLPNNLTPHSCRRTFSTRMSAAGARQEDIIALMGHTNFDVDIKHYINQEADTLYKAIKLMA